MQKFGFTILVLSASTVILAAQVDLRSNIAIVQSSPDEALVQTYNDIADWLENLRESKLAEDFRSQENGVHGTGFLLRFEEQMFLLTNYHVIKGYAEINVTFRPRESDEFEFSQVRVVYADPAKDLALMEVPDSWELSVPGLRLSAEAVVEDGDEVWAAGYPGLIASASWQLSLGNVTNEKVILDEVGLVGVDYLIQHSALIDPGSSGGPLLLAEDRQTVVGVNTLSVPSRNNTFFAIPAQTVEAFLQDYSTVESSDPAERLEQRVDEFVQQLAEEELLYAAMRSYLADDFGARYGWSTYKRIYKTMDSEPRKELDGKLFLSGRPLEALKEILAMVVHSEYGGQKNIEYSIESVFADRAEVEIGTPDNNSTMATTWVLDQGDWRLAEMDDAEKMTIRSQDDEEKSIYRTKYDSFGAIIGVAVLGSPAYSTQGAGGSRIGVGLNLSYRFPGKYFNYAIGAEFDHYSDLTVPPDTSKGSISSFSITPVDLWLKYPIFLQSNNVLIPFVNAGLSVGFAFNGDANSSAPLILYKISYSMGLEWSPDSTKLGSFGLAFTYVGEGYALSEMFSPFHSFGASVFYLF